MKKVELYLSCLGKDEKENMTNYLAFLRTNKGESKANLIEIATELYGEDVRLELAHDNGNSAWGSVANYNKSRYFYSVMMFKKEDLTDQALAVLGTTESINFPYYYAISLCKEDRKLYLVSFKDECCPNWNGRYNVDRFVELSNVDYPLLRDGHTIYRMDDALHAAINAHIAKGKPMFTEHDGMVSIVVKDQHGNYTKITGKTIDDVFRDYADHYTGYRNYRRQMASEWEIVDDVARQKYLEWKQSARGLKSDFDKFYGGGIVD